MMKKNWALVILLSEKISTNYVFFVFELCAFMD